MGRSMLRPYKEKPKTQVQTTNLGHPAAIEEGFIAQKARNAKPYLTPRTGSE